MTKTRIETPFRPVYPSPAGLIVSIDENKKPNVMAAAEVFNVGLKKPAIVGIALRKATYTHSLISKTSQFTVNFPTASILDKVDRTGTVSGRNGLDKFAAFGLTPLKSSVIDAPIIEECPVNLECRLLSVTEVGDHDLFLGEVVAMHVDSDKIDEKQKVIVSKLDGILVAEWAYYKFGEKMADFNFTKKQELKKE